MSRSEKKGDGFDAGVEWAVKKSIEHLKNVSQNPRIDATTRGGIMGAGVLIVEHLEELTGKTLLKKNEKLEQ